MQHLQPNSTLQGGKYRIEKVLGQGGFGITYLAYNNYENKYVAIKEFFLKELCGREESTRRVITHIDTTTIERFKAKFLKEARTLMSFTHRNIVRVFDCFEENNTAYYVMEYIQGSSISDILHQHGSLDERTAVSYIRKVAAALQYIHSMNINHLDVKPGNILLRSQDNEIVLIDFGTAKHYDTATGGATTMTQAGYSQGYAAIEQYRRGGVSTFTPETDIYSLGATLYKMLTNQTPPEPSLIIENGLPTMPSWISQGTSSAITAAMQINKASRPHSVSEFLKILDSDEDTGGVEVCTKASSPMTVQTFSMTKPIDENYGNINKLREKREHTQKVTTISEVNTEDFGIDTLQLGKPTSDDLQESTCVEGETSKHTKSKKDVNIIVAYVFLGLCVCTCIGILLYYLVINLGIKVLVAPAIVIIVILIRLVIELLGRE